MKEQLEQILPEEIEKRSFEMISEELGERDFFSMGRTDY